MKKEEEIGKLDEMVNDQASTILDLHSRLSLCETALEDVFSYRSTDVSVHEVVCQPQFQAWLMIRNKNGN